MRRTEDRDHKPLLAVLLMPALLSVSVEVALMSVEMLALSCHNRVSRRRKPEREQDI